MSEQFTVENVGPPREWRSEKFGGTFLAYPVDLKDEQGVLHIGIEWSRKVDSDAPKVDDTIIGTIQGGQHGEKLKVDWDAMKEKRGSNGSSRSSNGKRDWTPEGERDPEKVVRIGRAHAQEMAIRVLALPDTDGTIPDSQEELQDLIRFWTDFFEADVNNAAKAARGVDHPPRPQDESTPPQSLTDLLEAAGVRSEAASIISDYALQEMTEAEQQAAEQMLANPDRQLAAAKRLAERAEKAYGEPLPTGTDDDLLPF